MKLPKYHSWERPLSQVAKAVSNNGPMSRQICLQCKGGRLLCGALSCPLLSKLDLQIPVQENLKAHMFGPSASVFVGWKGYPDVYAGPMTAIEREGADVLDNPGAWYGMGFDDIVLMRSLLVRGRRRHGVSERSGFTQQMQELALSVRPIDVETNYVAAPHFSMSFSPVSQPMGASGEIKDMKVVDNPVIPRKVDSVISDELTAGRQVAKLFERKFDVYYLSNVLSSGVLGLSDKRKMVPTRWGITAVDDILGKELIANVRDYPYVGDYEVYENTYLGNHFEVLLIPGGWEFEQFETWAPDTLWTRGAQEPVIMQEHEPHKGRWEYAYNEGGGYYAGRFAVAEALERMRRQARVVVFREIYDSYVMPVGVWEVRENVRKAMENKPNRFPSLEAALSDAGTRLTINMKKYVEKSMILKQRRITEYL